MISFQPATHPTIYKRNIKARFACIPFNIEAQALGVIRYTLADESLPDSNLHMAERLRNVHTSLCSTFDSDPTSRKQRGGVTKHCFYFKQKYEAVKQRSSGCFKYDRNQDCYMTLFKGEFMRTPCCSWSIERKDDLLKTIGRQEIRTGSAEGDEKLRGI